MAEPADGVVQCLRWREGLVTTLVGEDPETGTRQTLHDGVERPETGSDGRGCDVLRRTVVVEEVEGTGELDDVASHVRQTAKTRPLEAVGWDSIANLLDGVVWDLELIAIRVQQLSPLVLSEGLIDGAEGGEGGGGWRLVW